MRSAPAVPRVWHARLLLPLLCLAAQQLSQSCEAQVAFPKPKDPPIVFSSPTPEQLADLPFLDKHSELEEPLILPRAPGFVQPTKEEWDQFISENLGADVVHFKARTPIPLSNLREQVLSGLARYPRDRLGLLMFRKGMAYAWFHGAKFAIKRTHQLAQLLEDTATRLADAKAAGARSSSSSSSWLSLLPERVPDTLLALNAMDNPFCRRFSNCSLAPVFSLFKKHDFARNASVDVDILLPHIGHVYGKLMFYPWSEKDPRAMMRAGFYKTMHQNCPRVHLARLSQTHRGAEYLDAGVIGPLAEERLSFAREPPLEKKGYVPMTDHAKWRFLINTDGHTASCRLGHIMQTNSVILKQDSSWIEYYYRSLKPGVHYLPFSTAEGLLQTLQQFSSSGGGGTNSSGSTSDSTNEDQDRRHGKRRRLRSSAGDGNNHQYNDKQLRDMALASQRFGYKFLSPQAKLRYTIEAIQQYNALFGGKLERFVRELDMSKFGKQYMTLDGKLRYKIPNLKRVFEALPQNA